MTEEDLWIDGPDDIANAPMPKRRGARSKGRNSNAKSAGTYTMIPHDRGLKLAKCTGDSVLAVLIALECAIYEAKRNRAARCNRVALTNHLLKRYRITHQAKNRGLRRLTATGVITVEWSNKSAPMVTHHWYTKGGELKGVR